MAKRLVNFRSLLLASITPDGGVNIEAVDNIEKDVAYVDISRESAAY